jgi:hypothetical protein
MAAEAGLREIPGTPQKRGFCDAKIKRLEAGSFQLPDAGRQDGVELRPAQLAMILSGIDLNSARQRKRFRPAGAAPRGNPGNRRESIGMT